MQAGNLMPEFDIIIPHYGTGRLTDLARTCLETHRKWSRNYRIILVDNASPELDALLPELELHDHVLVRNTQNLGFVQATNQGIELSTAPYVVFMNNDTEAVPGWLEALREPLLSICDAAGPLTTAHGSWQGRWPMKRNRFWRVLEPHRMLAFFCTMFKREVFERVGLLDEDFGVGFGDDDHYCWKMTQAGMKLALVQHLVIPHHHRSTFKELYGADQIRTMQTQALALFHSKSGVTRQTP